METRDTIQQVDARRRKWAEGQIAALRRQVEGLEKRIAEFDGFLALLDQSAAAVGNGDLFVGEPPSPSLPPGSSLGDYLVTALKQGGAKGLGAHEVSKKIEALGYKNKSRSPIHVLVGSELYRLSKDGRRGIVKVGPGRFSVTSSGL